MLETIQTTLSMLAKEERIYIIYACESGSRAWGFPSSSSDYDVRFLYVRPKHHYLRLDTPKDTMTPPLVDTLDFHGWDIFKALRLLRKSNPPLIEWLSSPLIYREVAPYIGSLRHCIDEYFSPYTIASHYFHMARGHWRKYLEDKIPLKKYLYVIRSILSFLFIHQKNKIPPVNIFHLLDALSLEKEVEASILTLLEAKCQGSERSPMDAVLHQFIQEELARFVDCAPSCFNEEKKKQFDSALEDILAHILIHY